ncbi:nucleosome assembly protein 1-like 1 [Anopheles aquasalis]|uniref:nucleosome assembly protein 1-like 1 n=1 Tax=Anopheles aquasalis TaxID=42839 RepID=UPI00215AD800|nr:nucleosome assembly protein 1-like 1 [Anopheles aquasalis]
MLGDCVPNSSGTQYIEAKMDSPTTVSSPATVADCTVKDTLEKQIANIDERIKQLVQESQGSSSGTGTTANPPSIAAKVQALRKVQQQIVEKEVKLYLTTHAMEVEFQSEFRECYDTLAQIVSGSAGSPNLVESEANPNDRADQALGVAGFWLTVLKASMLDHLIEEADEPALQKLKDIRCELKSDPTPGFVLVFHFEPNDFFTNEVLTKEYFLRCAPDPLKPSMFNGFEIFHCVGCRIDWKEGQNLIEQSESDREDAAGASFFSFFEPERCAPDDCDPDIGVALMECDFQYGYYIREKIIPRAVSLFLREIDNVKETCDKCTCQRCMYKHLFDSTLDCSNSVGQPLEEAHDQMERSDSQERALQRDSGINI